MESTFTRHPEPVSNSETSWKDNLEYQEEYDKEWKGDSKFALPKRTSPYRFPRVPDYHDEGFDSTSADGTFFTHHVFSLDAIGSHQTLWVQI
jgi:hypothetical protein